MRYSSGRTILVIDDNAVVLEVTRSTLEQAGFRVVTRDRANCAVVAVLQERPDLVLLDVNMPHTTGDSLAEILGRTRATRGTLIVLYSSLPANALRMKTLAAGAHGFIQKTGAQAELVRQVRAFLEQDSLGAQRVASILAGEEQPSSGRMRAALPLDEPVYTDRRRQSTLPPGAPPSSRSFRRGSASLEDGLPEDRVFVVCFDSKLIFVYDPAGNIERTITTGRGPHALAVDTANGLGYVAHFTDSYVGVIDLNKAHGATYGKLILTLGQPQAPRAAK